MGLVGIIQNQPDGRVLVIAEGEKKDDLERFASEIRIENALIHVEDVSAKYSQGTGQYSTFRKITGSNEVGAITKDIAATTKDTAITVKDLTTLTKEGLAKQDQGLDKMDQMLHKQDQSLDKMDQMLHKQDETIEAIRDLKRDDERFVRMEKDIRMIKNRLGIR
jgi:hypothetical protein